MPSRNSPSSPATWVFSPPTCPASPSTASSSSSLAPPSLSTNIFSTASRTRRDIPCCTLAATVLGSSPSTRAAPLCPRDRTSCRSNAVSRSS